MSEDVCPDLPAGIVMLDSAKDSAGDWLVDADDPRD